MGGSSTQWVTDTLCPLLGVVIANVMWASPLMLVLDARRSKNIGKINPIPFAVIVVNCIGWLIFSVVTVDYFIFFANCAGLIIGLYFCTTSLQLLSHGVDQHEDDIRTRKLIEYIILIGITIWLGVCFVCFVLYNGKYLHMTQLIVGSLCDVTNILYFASPLSTMKDVIMNSDASSLYVPTIIVNLLNGVMWFFYGLLGKPDMNVWIPNGLGAVLAFLQLILAFIYRKGNSNPQFTPVLTEDLVSNDSLLENKLRFNNITSPNRPRMNKSALLRVV